MANCGFAKAVAADIVVLRALALIPSDHCYRKGFGCRIEDTRLDNVIFDPS